MNPARSAIALLGLLLAPLASAQEVELFNGKDLTGWRGLPEVWSVRDGAITGQGTQATESTYLVWQGGTVTDFEFTCQYKLVPAQAGGNANSGVQFRAEMRREKTFELQGYQAEMEAGARQPVRWPKMPSINGCLIEEEPGRLLAATGQKTVARSGSLEGNPFMGLYTETGYLGTSQTSALSFRKNDWNDFRVIADEDHIRIFVNGLQTVDVIDTSKRYKTGLLGLEYFGGEAKTIQFRNLKLKALRVAPPATLATTSGSSSPSPAAALQSPPPPSHVVLLAHLEEYFWEWTASGAKTTVRFDRNGTAFFKGRSPSRWKSTSPQTVEMTLADGTTQELQFDPAYTEFLVKTGSGIQATGIRGAKVPPRLQDIVVDRAWAWKQVWAPPSKRWTEVRFAQDGTLTAYRGTAKAYTGKWEVVAPNQIRIPNDKIPHISRFGYYLTFNENFTEFEAHDLGRCKVPGLDIGLANQAPAPLPPPTPADELRTAPVWVGGDSNGGTNFGYGETKRTLRVSVNTASDDYIHVTLKAAWVVLDHRTRQPIPSRMETRRFTIGGDYPYSAGITITSKWLRTNGATDGITNEDGVLRGWVARAYDVHGKEIGCNANLPIYRDVGK